MEVFGGGVAGEEVGFAVAVEVGELGGASSGPGR
jgi:hypothetical protein